MMQVKINDDLKIVEVWLSKVENEDPVIRTRLKSMYAAYQQKKYMVVVYKSGRQDMYTNVRDLLAYNRRKSAELAVKNEKQPFRGDTAH